MNHSMARKALGSLAFLGLLALSACGKIPEGYRGTFVDRTTGDRLELKESEGTLTLASGKTLIAKAQDYDFKTLLKGEPGIYVRATSEDKDNIEVFWIQARPETQREEAGFRWVEAEVVYTKMKGSQRDKVQAFELIRCTDGMVLLDLPNQTFNGGCPATAIRNRMVRTDK